MSEYITDKHHEGDKHKGHRARVRNKIVKGGFDSLLDYEKLEALLFWPIARRDTKDIAVDLINKFGSFNGVLDAEPEQLLTVANLGESSVFFINLLKQVAEVYLRNMTKPIMSFTDSNMVEKNILDRLSVEKVERLNAYFLDDQLNLLREESYISSHSNRIFVDISEIIRVAAITKCSQLIIAHNHPVGIPTPSQEDLNFTKELDDVTRAIHVRLLQHYIVGEGKCVPIMR